LIKTDSVLVKKEMMQQFEDCLDKMLIDPKKNSSSGFITKLTEAKPKIKSLTAKVIIQFADYNLKLK